MSEVQPTQGRVTFREDGDANHYSMLTEDGRWWLAILANGEQTSARQVANFRRLAACWNACEGIDTAMLEGFSPRFLATYPDRALAERRALESQRDELLSALNYLVGCSAPMTSQQEECWKAARAAISKVTGTTP